jgi:hypothetical protein
VTKSKKNTHKIKINQRKNHKGIFIIVLLVIIVALLLGGYLHHRHDDSLASEKATSTKLHFSAAPPADNNPNDSRKTSSTPAPTLSTPTTGSSTTDSASYTVQILNANVNDGNIHIGTQVNGTTTGTCTLTATQSGQSTLQLGSSSVAQDVNSYDCGVFNIPTSKFPSSGNWQLILTVTNNATQASGNYTVAIP